MTGRKFVKIKSSCPKCGGDMTPRNFIVNPNETQKIVQCKVCKFYVKFNFK